MGVGGAGAGGFWGNGTTEYTEYTEGFWIVGVWSWSSRMGLEIVG